MTKKFNIEKVVTHAGRFHADEVLAIATLHLYNEIDDNTPIVRVNNPSQEDLNNPAVWVIDVGGEFNAVKKNFDHHQNPDLAAASTLVFMAVCDISNPSFNMHLFNNLFDNVSLIDCGKMAKPSTDCFNSIIANFNSLPNGFDLALNVAKLTLQAYMQTADSAVKSDALWASTEKFDKYFVHSTNEEIIGWREKAIKADKWFMVCPNNRGGWMISSVNSELYNIPAHESQTFRHNSGFMAVYPDKQTAIAHCQCVVESFQDNSSMV